jgi:hypothetical protein
MIVTKHPVLHMQFFQLGIFPEGGQFWPKHVVLYSYVNVKTHISQYIHSECVHLLFNVCKDGIKMEARLIGANGILKYRFYNAILPRNIFI